MLNSYNFHFSDDSFTYHNQSDFSTLDRDNDNSLFTSCAQERKAGWWYKNCQQSNLNGIYGSTVNYEGVNWYSWKGYKVSMTGTRMMVKPKA